MISSQDGACARQCGEHVVVRERWRERCDGVIEAFDDLEGRPELLGQGDGLERAGFDNGGVVG